MKPRPTLRAIPHYPGITHLDVGYPDGRETRFAMDMQTYATAWSRALARGGGIGYVVAYLKRRVGTCVAVQTLKLPTPAAEQRTLDLAANPGPTFGP